MLQRHSNPFWAGVGIVTSLLGVYYFWPLLVVGILLISYSLVRAVIDSRRRSEISAAEPRAQEDDPRETARRRKIKDLAAERDRLVAVHNRISVVRSEDGMRIDLPAIEVIDARIRALLSGSDVDDALKYPDALGRCHLDDSDNLDLTNGDVHYWAVFHLNERLEALSRIIVSLKKPSEIALELRALLPTGRQFRDEYPAGELQHLMEKGSFILGVHNALRWDKRDRWDKMSDFAKMVAWLDNEADLLEREQDD